jgi:hypothetical protein
MEFLIVKNLNVNADIVFVGLKLLIEREWH